MTSTARVLAVRHGETLWNVAGRMQGYLDSPLDASGLAQADALGVRLAAASIEALYVSDLGRTLETARRIAAHTGHALVPDARLRERHLGIFQGLTGDEASDLYPDHWRRFRSRDPEHTLESGESLRQFSTRVVAAVEALAAPHAGGTILVVTHGGVLDCLRRHATGLALDGHRTYTLLNASLNTFSVGGSMWALVDWGDVSHLGLRDSIDDV